MLLCEYSHTVCAEEELKALTPSSTIVSLPGSSTFTPPPPPWRLEQWADGSFLGGAGRRSQERWPHERGGGAAAERVSLSVSSVGGRVCAPAVVPGAQPGKATLGRGEGGGVVRGAPLAEDAFGSCVSVCLCLCFADSPNAVI